MIATIYKELEQMKEEEVREMGVGSWGEETHWKKIKKINTLSKEEKIIPYLLRLLVKVEELEML